LTALDQADTVFRWTLRPERGIGWHPVEVIDMLLRNTEALAQHSTAQSLETPEQDALVKYIRG
jgi:hypothetical protein